MNRRRTPVDRGRLKLEFTLDHVALQFARALAQFDDLAISAAAGDRQIVHEAGRIMKTQ